jgi:beta-lactamase regulating signal transducer with metallopeptidase domain
MNPVLAVIGRALLDSTLAIAIVATASRLLPRMPAAMRANLWWLASLAALVGLLPIGTVRMPAAVPPLVQTGIEAALAPAGSLAPVSAPNTPDGWPGALVVLWAVGALFVLARHVREQIRLDLIWKRAVDADSGTVASWAWPWFKSPGWNAVPAVRVSEETTVPLTIGWLRPRILVPAGSEAGTLRLALAHEFAHVRRHDLLFGWVPAIAQVVLWFSPLTWWAVREYGQAREEACDADALELASAAPREYGELLLHFGVAQPMPSSAVALCGSRTAQALERRLMRLGSALETSRSMRMAGALAVALVAAVILPVRVVGSDRDSSRFFYAFHQEGEKGTRGSLDQADFGSIERLSAEDDGSFWMFRLGNERWVVRDPQLIREGLAELVPQDEIEREMAPVRKRIAEINLWLADRRARQDAQSGRPDPGLTSEIEHLNMGWEAAIAREEKGRRKMEAIRPAMEARLAALGRRAIDQGKAERVR